MKVTKKLIKKSYAFFMAFVMVIGLSTSPVLTAYAEENVEVESSTGSRSWYNDDLYDSLEEAQTDLAEVSAVNEAADIADNYLTDEGEVVEVPTFNNPTAAAEYMRKCMVERRSVVKFNYDFNKIYNTFSNAKAMAEKVYDDMDIIIFEETEESDEGDYLYFHTGDYTYNYEMTLGTDTIEVSTDIDYVTTAAQEISVTNTVESVLKNNFAGWENHTDTSNAEDVFYWMIDYSDYLYSTGYDEDSSAYGLFVLRETDSYGYATATYRLLKEMGISNRIVKYVNDSDPYVWNIVGIDGLYYNFDAYMGDKTYYKYGNMDVAAWYLLVGDDIINEKSIDMFYESKYYRDTYYNSDAFHAAYPMAAGDYLRYDPSVESEIIVTNPTVGVTYHTHVQSFGWQNWVTNGAMSGTSGKAKRLEGIEIKLTGNTGLDLGIEYKTHIQSYGWEAGWKQNGAMSGTSGKAKRLEAIKIRLTGTDAAKYDVYYRVHAQSYGWLGWAKNGEEAGTAGQGKRLEGIEIKVVKKGTVPGGIIGYSYIEYGKTADQNSEVTGMVNYRTHVQSYGWQGYVYDGSLSGTFGEGKRLESINISLGNTGYSGGITYRTHIQSIGWQAWKSNGAMSGTSGQAKRLEAIEIKLTGEVAKHYDVYYRVHAQSYGWLDWAKNGQSAGTAGYGKRLESIQIVLLPKGSAAPGATARPYVSK